MKVPISFLIPVRNEEKNLPRCLESISWADEILVVDSQSTDRTVEIAEQHGARVVQFHFNGTWPKKRNWTLDNVPIRHEWVFILDADETLPPGAEEELRTLVSGNGRFDAYWVNRRFMFLGRWLNHAYYPNWILRFFKHRKARYAKLTDAVMNSTDNEVHEPMEVDGPAGRMRSEIAHYAFPTIESFVERHNLYSNWEAHVELNDTGGEGLKNMSLRQKLKRWSRRLPCRPFLRFLFVYVWQRGFLDGREGYYFARLHGIYEFLSVAKAYELKKRMAETANRERH